MRALVLAGLVLVGCGSRSVTSSAPDSLWKIPITPSDGKPLPPDLPIWRKDGVPPYLPDAPSLLRTCQSYCVTKADCGVAGFACVGGKCVQCKADTDCTYGPKRCDTSTGVCRMCLADADCWISGAKFLTGMCDTPLGQCLRCTSDADCAFTGGLFKYCSVARNSCVMCKADADCSALPYFKRCDVTMGTCSLCTSNADCCAGWPNPAACHLTCDQPSGRCSCASDAECVMPNSGGLKWSCK